MYSMITDDLNDLKKNLERWDRYFINYFDASVTNQFILIVTIVSEIVLIFLYQKSLGQHFWILATDTLVMIIEIMFLKMYRKRMIDLEMDYSVVIAGKIYFVNQSGVLSSIQTIESKKIKTIRSVFPNRIASIFDYGTIDILTEGDTQNLMWSLNMYYVNNPDAVVANIQSLIERPRHEGKGGQTVEDSQSESDMPPSASESIEHTLDTKGKVKEVLE